MLINTEYLVFLKNFYKIKNHRKLSYHAQLKKRFKTLFGMNNFYSSGFKKQGHDAKEFFYNNDILQKQWAKENNKKLNFLYPFRYFLKFNRFLDFFGFPSMGNIWYDQVLEAQIKKYKPNVILNQNMSYIKNDFFKRIKKENSFIKLIIGQHSAPLTKNLFNPSAYDLIISATNAVVNFFEKKHFPSKLIKLGFGGDQILNKINYVKKSNDVIFIGTISNIHHRKRTVLLEEVAKHYKNFVIYGNTDSSVHASSILRKLAKPPLWGEEMYKVIKQSKICLNVHGELKLPKQHAANMRLYEVAGVGTFLLTDDMPKMNDILKVDTECSIFKDPKDCVKKIDYYLKNDKEREKIAKAGQKRILKEHLYTDRAKEIITELNKLLKVNK